MLAANNEPEWSRTPWANPENVLAEIGATFPDKRRAEVRSLKAEFDGLSEQAARLPTKETIAAEEAALMGDSSITVESLVNKVRELRETVERAPSLAQEIDRRQREIRKKFAPPAADILKQLRAKIHDQLEDLPTLPTVMAKWDVTGGDELRRLMEFPLRRLLSIVEHDEPALRSGNLDLEVMWSAAEILRMAGVIGNHTAPSIPSKK